MMLLFSVLPDELMINILFYLPVKEILRLDCAITNKLYRKHWKKILHNSISPNYYCQDIYLMKDYDITGVVVLKNDYVVVSTSANDILLLNLKEFTHQAIVRDYEESFEGIYTFPDDDNLLLSVSELGMVTTWNITTREIVCRFHPPSIVSAARYVYPQSSGRVIIGYGGIQKPGTLSRWDCRTGVCEKEIVEGIIICCCSLFDGRQIAVGRPAGQISIFNGQTGTLEKEWTVGFQIISLQQLQDDRLMVVPLNSHDLVQVWEIDRTAVATLSMQSLSIPHSGIIYARRVIQANRLCLLVLVHCHLYLFDVERRSFELIGEAGGDSWVTGLCLLPGGRVVVGSDELSLEVWDLCQRRERERWCPRVKLDSSHLSDDQLASFSLGSARQIDQLSDGRLLVASMESLSVWSSETSEGVRGQSLY